MAEITNELMFETLKKIQSDMSSLRVNFGEMKSEMTSMRGHLYAIQGDVKNIYTVLARHDDRLERIESRLELRELAEASAKFDHTK